MNTRILNESALDLLAQLFQLPPPKNYRIFVNPKRHVIYEWTQRSAAYYNIFAYCVTDHWTGHFFQKGVCVTQFLA